MAGTLELLFRFQPVRRATQMRADGGQCKYTGRIRVLIVCGAHQPDGEFLFESFIDLADLNLVRVAGFERRRRFEENIGKHESRGRRHCRKH